MNVAWFQHSQMYSEYMHRHSRFVHLFVQNNFHFFRVIIEKNFCSFEITLILLKFSLIKVLIWFWFDGSMNQSKPTLSIRTIQNPPWVLSNFISDSRWIRFEDFMILVNLITEFKIIFPIAKNLNFTYFKFWVNWSAMNIFVETDELFSGFLDIIKIHLLEILTN